MTTTKPATIIGMVETTDTLMVKYRVLVERIHRMPMSAASRARVVAEVQAIYRAERAAIQPASMVVRMMGQSRTRG